MNVEIRTQNVARRICRSLLLGLIFFVAISASAQTDRKPEERTNDQQEKPLARIETIEAKIPLRAFDLLGKRVLNLTPKDVVVIENGAGRQVTSLKFEPVNLLLVLDHSLEMGTHKNGRVIIHDSTLPDNSEYQLIKDPSSVEFAENLISLLGKADRIAIIQYSDKVELIQNWTVNHKEAMTSLRMRFRFGRKTRLYDALMLAAEKFKNSPAGRSVLVLLTDGVDTASEAQKEDAMTALARVGATLYVVNWGEALKDEITKTKPKILSGHGGTPTDTASAGVSINISPSIFKRNKELKAYLKKVSLNAKELATVAENTGGEGYLLKSFDDLVRKPAEIMQEIGAQYTLTYLTEKRSDEEAMRKVEVVGARIGLSVRARKNYFVGKDPDK